jgi:hypothetical protein
MRNAKRQRRLEETNQDPCADNFHDDHWEGLSDDEESDIEVTEPENDITIEREDAFERLLSAAKTEWSQGVGRTKFPYQRGPILCECQRSRISAAEHSLASAAQMHSQPLSQFFPAASSTPNEALVSTSESSYQLQHKAIVNLEKKLCSKKTILEGQNLIRRRAVLALLYLTPSSD